MAAQPNEMPPRVVLAYVEQMLVELARMAEVAGRSDLASRIENLAAETALEMTGLAFNSTPPGPLAAKSPDRPN